MERSSLGRTGVEVSRIGLGLAQIGGFGLEDAPRVARLLETALDQGIDFLDTAASYRNSEELLGKSLGPFRDDFFLATKVGHWAAEVPWTAETVRTHIHRSLARLQTDHLDLVQLHSCGVDILEEGKVIRALLDARDSGETRFIGYSGDNEPALWAVRSGLFDTLQTSFNLVDQKARTRLLPEGRAQGMGQIVKRTIANGTWTRSRENSGTTVQFDTLMKRVERMHELGPVPGAPDDPVLLAMGFTLAHEEVDVALIGSTDPDHVIDNVRRAESCLPLPNEVIEVLHARFDLVGRDWPQLT